MIERKIILNQPHKYQQQVVSESQRFNVLCCGRRWGKSALSVNLLSEPAIGTAQGNALPVGYFTPTYKLLDGTYNEVVMALEPAIKRKHEHQFIELHTGGRIEFWSLENELAGRSRKYKRVIVDEAAFVKDLWKKWTESIRPTLTDLKGDAWFLSTPRGKNDFWKLFMRGKSGQDRWASWQMPTLTNPFIDPEEIADAKADLPAHAFSQEYEAEFLENVANPFGHAFIQQCTFPLSTEPPVCFGIDLGKKLDWTVIIGLDRFGMVCHFDRFQADWGTVNRKILDLPRVPMCIDSTGVGDAIAEPIAQVRDVEMFIYTANSKQQIMEGLAAAIQKRDIGFPEGPIKDELETFEYVFTRTGVKYSAPEGLHDDCVCALGQARRKWLTAANNSNGPSVW